MNVLLVVPWDNIGGVANVVNRIAQHMRSQGAGVFFLLPGPSTHPEPVTSRLGFPGFRMNTRPTSIVGRRLRSRVAFALTLPITLLRLARLIRRLEIDVVNIHYPAGDKVYFAMLRRLGVVRLVTSIHGTDMLGDAARQPAERRSIVDLLHASDAVVAPSSGYRQAVAGTWPEVDAPIRTIPNGVDPVELGYGQHDDAPEDPPYVLSIAHLIHYKGVDVLIRAFAAVAESYPRLTLRLVSDGPQRATLEKLVADLGLTRRVQFLGVLDRPAVSEQLRRCTLFVMPSRSESFGLAAAEAMALDRPVIASRVGGLPDLVEDGVSGLLVPPDDVPALECAMRRLLDDATPRLRMGRAAGVRVRERFHWDRACALYQNLFEELVASASTEPRARHGVPAPADGYPVSAKQPRSKVEQPSSVSLTPVGQSEEGW